jgi:hypothetical protein
VPYWIAVRIAAPSREDAVGRKELEALVAVLQQQLASADNIILGAWSIVYSRDFQAFLFEKCEIGGYCEERPSVIGIDGKVKDRGGPLLGDPV